MTPRPTRTRRDGLFWNPQTKHWHLDFKDATGRRRRPKASPDKATAKLMYANLVVRLAREEITGVREEGLLFRTFVDERYWPAVAPTLAPSWAERSRKWILDTTLLPRFGGLALRAIKPEAIARWYAERRSEVSPSTANKDLSRLKHALGQAVEWGYLTVSPAAKIRKAKEPPGRVVLLEPEVREKLLEGFERIVTASDGRRWSWPVRPSRTLRLYIEAVLLSAARRGELTRLTWPDVDLGRRQVSFRQTKNGYARTIPMSRDLEALFRRLPRPMDRRAPVLPVIDPEVLTRAFARWAERIGHPEITLHDLRHDAASRMTQAGVNQRVVMEVLGHRDPRMTIRYQHLAPGHLAEAVQALNLPVRGATDGTYKARGQRDASGGGG